MPPSPGSSPCGVPLYCGHLVHVFDDDGACADRASEPESHARKDRGVRPYGNIVFYYRYRHMPILTDTGIFVIREADVRPDEHAVAYRDSGRYEGERLDFAHVAYRHANPDLHESGDLAISTDADVAPDVGWGVDYRSVRHALLAISHAYNSGVNRSFRNSILGRMQCPPIGPGTRA